MQSSQQNNNELPHSPESDHSHESLDSYSTSLVDGKKTYSCLAPNCGKVFKFKSEIKRHTIIHGSDRPFKCTFPGCKKTFKRSDALGNHVKLHERPSQYDCPIPGCKVQLNTKASLQYHLSKHSEQQEEIFRCNFPGCNQSFLTYKHLSHHEKSTHYAQNVPEMMTMKRPLQMMVSPPAMENNGFEAFMYGNKKMAVQSYLPPMQYEEESSPVDHVKAEYSEGLVQPAFIQAPSSSYEENIKNALMNTLAENQRLKKEYMLTMKILQNNNNQARNQAFLASAYKSLNGQLFI